MRRPTAGHDAVDDVQQVRVVVELDVGQLHAPAPLDVDLLRAVDEDVRDLLVREQRLERAEAHHLVLDMLEHAPPLVEIERRALFLEQAASRVADLLARDRLVDRDDQRQVHDLQQAIMDAQLPFVLEPRQGGLARRFADRPARRRSIAVRSRARPCVLPQQIRECFAE